MHRELELLFLTNQRIKLLFDNVDVIMAANVVFVLGVVVEAEVAKHNCVRLVLKQPLKHILALELAIDDTIRSI